MKAPDADIGDQLLRKRIRILKTGLYGVERYLDMTEPSSRAFFEDLARPGTELVLARNRQHPESPFRIDVYAKSGQFLGRVTEHKCQTAARLMDAGFELVAIVNESLPFHDSDYNFGVEERPGDPGWCDDSRIRSGHSLCNLPYGIYLVDE